MDLRLFLVTFVAVFVAELGDKTQLATMSFAAGHRHALWLVFAASALALVSASALGVAAGGLVAQHVQPRYIKVAAGVLFILIGLATLLLPDRKRERAFGRLHRELERYAAIDQCRTCARFQATVRDMAAHGHPELRGILKKLELPPDQHQEPCDRLDCSAQRIRALFDDERSRSG